MRLRIGLAALGAGVSGALAWHTTTSVQLGVIVGTFCGIMALTYDFKY